ncbi:MAG: hypothetical protein ACI8P2_000907, partial [Candidatus Latescibacterota bacterium]
MAEVKYQWGAVYSGHLLESLQAQVGEQILDLSFA